jgi:hypothetical protein
VCTSAAARMSFAVSGMSLMGRTVIQTDVASAKARLLVANTRGEVHASLAGGLAAA